MHLNLTEYLESMGSDKTRSIEIVELALQFNHYWCNVLEIPMVHPDVAAELYRSYEELTGGGYLCNLDTIPDYVKQAEDVGRFINFIITWLMEA